ncbi:MAG TPA: rhodanese-like domain-containing protein [Terriglobia bacterium]|nr:rhodanese-like domain-containing protein [Terriglobia bacterium]
MKIEVTGKQLAAGVAVLLGLVAALAATTVGGTGAGPVDAPKLVQAIMAETDHVTAGELAGWILQKNRDYLLVDIRDPWQFDDYHIPTAINIPLGQLFEDSGLKQLSREKKIVVYGLGVGRASQAQLLLSLKGYNSFSLEEGLGGWWDAVMTPTSLRSENASPAGYLQAKALREHFTGAPAAGAKAPAASPPVAVPAAPPANAGAAQPNGPSNKKLKLGRGCS